MKKLLLVIALVMIFIAPMQSFAQDTLVIYASQGNLNDIISADTLTGGAQAHAVYSLVSLDTTYKFAGPITATSDISVIGTVDPVTKRPPCIQPLVLQDASIPGTLFILNGNGIKGTFKNLYLLAVATNNTASGGGIAMQVTADNVRLTVDNCIFDGWQQFGIGYNGNWDDFFVSNSNFRNMVHSNQWYIGEVIRNMWPGEAYTDTMSFVGNTMLCVNGYAACPVTKFYETYFEFNQNKVFYTFKNPLFIFNVTDARINDNIFYGLYAGGVSVAENPWWDNLWSPDTTYGVVSLDTLNEANAKLFSPADSADADIRNIADKKRKVEVNNNTYFWPTTLTDFWTAWNDTATTTAVRTASFMNEKTTAMFADDARYPDLVATGNVNVDPGTMTNLDSDILSGTSGNDVGLIEYFKQVRTATAATDVWGYKMTQVSGAADWVPLWPLPEVAFVTAIEEQAAAAPRDFSLKQNYPNPFNPTTSLTYTVAKAGKVSLKVYDIRGRLVSTLLNSEMKSAGTYQININMSDMPSGVYHAVLQKGTASISKKMVLLK